MADNNTPSNRGFRAMSDEEADRIRSLGGKNSPQNFKHNRELARKAGKKGGQRSRRPPT
jgi:general stress protein YciG